MISRLFSLAGFTALLLSPTAAQFGVAGGNRKKGGTSFQELNEKAKKEGANANAVAPDMDALMKQLGMDPSDLQKMMGEIDPKMLKGLTDLGPAFDDAMKLMADMNPEDLQKQMKEAMDMFTSGDMMDNLFQNQDAILKSLEESGAVDAVELAKFKTDPEYFQQKMKEGLGQMKELFSDPDMIKLTTASLKQATEMIQNPEKLNDMMGEMMGALTDEDIEEARKMFLGEGGLANNPMLKQLLGPGGADTDTDEIDAMLKDPKKFRAMVKEGLKGAGVGEL